MVGHGSYGVKIYSCQIYDGSTLIRDFIPVKDEDGVGCMYDRANGKFYYNAGTGDFLLGSETGQQVENEVARKVKGIYVGVNETYKFLDYLDSTGVQFIDTGIIPTKYTKLEMKFQLNDRTQGGGACIFGVIGEDSSDTYTGGAFALMCVPGSNLKMIVGNTAITATTTAVETDYTVSCKDGEFIVNGTTYTGGGSWIEQTDSIFLFRSMHHGGQADGAYGYNTTDARIYYCKIYHKTTLIRDFVPAKRNSDGVCGMYDNVTETFFCSVGPFSGTENGNSVNKEVARKVKKGYVGVSGTARQFFASEDKNIVAVNSYHSTNPTYQKQTVACTADYGIIAGGFDTASSNAPKKTVYAIDENGVYTAGPDLTQATGLAQTTTFNGYAVFAGGKSGNNSGSSRSAKVDCYSNSLVKTTAPDLQESVYDHAVTANSTHMMVAFGNTYSGTSVKVQSYDTSLVKTILSNASYTRMGKCGASNDDYIIFQGGLNGTSADARVYDNNNVLWRLYNAYNNSYSKWPCGISSHNVAYFFGANLTNSQSSTSSKSDKIFAYDKNLVLQSSKMPWNSCYGNGVSIDENRILYGGCRYNSFNSRNFYTYKNMVFEGRAFSTSATYVGAEAQSFCAGNDKFCVVKSYGGEGSYTNNANYIAKIL